MTGTRSRTYRLTRVIPSYCVEIRRAVTNGGPRSIRSCRGNFGPIRVLCQSIVGRDGYFISRSRRPTAGFGRRFRGFLNRFKMINDIIPIRKLSLKGCNSFLRRGGCGKGRSRGRGRCIGISSLMLTGSLASSRITVIGFEVSDRESTGGQGWAFKDRVGSRPTHRTTSGCTVFTACFCPKLSQNNQTFILIIVVHAVFVIRYCSVRADRRRSFRFPLA